MRHFVIFLGAVSEKTHRHGRESDDAELRSGEMPRPLDA